MPLCPEGHETPAHDFCDQCGLPIPAPDPEAAPPAKTEAPADQPVTCPNCGTPRPGSALFCESCGYDYTTGAMPEQDLRSELGLPPAPPAPEPEPGWVAEVWVDPQWHTLQESSDPLPPQGPPRIVALKDRALIGRVSVSRNIHPDIDCELDSGCSRRQAYLTFAGGTWYINDLDSANGTFVSSATGALPETPITGRTQIDADTRIYVGAWTRIVVRPAIPGETATSAKSA